MSPFGQNLSVYVVGRQNSSSRPDICLPAQEASVGRRHIELTVSGDGECYIVDLNSRNGTFIAKNGRWERIDQTTVQLNTPIKLGSYETTPARLLQFQINA